MSFTREYHALFLRSRGLVRVGSLGESMGRFAHVGRGWFRFEGNTCRRLAGVAWLQPTLDTCPLPTQLRIAAHRRHVAAGISSLSILGRFSNFRLQIEVSAKLLHRLCGELFLDEYIKISNLDSQRKIVDLRKTFKILRCGFSRSLDGKCDSERQHLLLPSKKSLPLNRGWQRLMAIGFPSTLSFSLFLFCHTIARVPFGPL